jgi:adenylate cyclase
MKRQLAAILHADVAGYSRLTGQNEEQTHQQLNTSLNLLSEIITDHDGIKIHEAGDAILAEFTSVTEAVEAALQFQKNMAERDSEPSGGELIELRIGVNIGEVIHDRDDIYGDGVNIAARIQELATPGSLCVSSAVFDQLSRNTHFDYEDLGYRDFKNIEKSVHVYQLKPKDFHDSHPMSSIESRFHNQPMFDDTMEKRLVTKGQCACGSIGIEISQQALGAGFCHCKICKQSTGAPVSAWVAFPIEAVKFIGDQPRYYRLSLIAERGFCEKCGGPVLWRGLKPEAASYLAIPITILDNPEDYAPTWHGGIESQVSWLQIHDDLPRARCEESPFLQKAWGSMSAADPEKWVTLDYEHAQFVDDDSSSD